MRRKVVLTAVVAFTLTLGAVLAHLQATRSRPRCGLEEYKAIQLGMTLEEAVAIVGVPPGDYTDGHVREFRSETEYSQQEFIPPVDRKSVSYAQWMGAKGRIALQFDAGGHVWVKDFTPIRGGPRCAMFTWIERTADQLIIWFGL